MRINSAMIAVFLIVATPVSALAHAKMTSSVPKDGATVATGLSEIELVFSHPMRLTLIKIMRGKEKADVPAKGELPKAFVTSAKITVEPLPGGSYEVSWTAVSDDGHIMNGGFNFAVADAKDAQTTQ